jgi:hypothetical protein
MRLSLLASALSLSGALAAAVSNSQTSLALLFQNNLNYTDDANHAGLILTDTFTQAQGAEECEALGESLVSSSEIQAHLSDFNASFSYLVHAHTPIVYNNTSFQTEL